jgi:DNA invertase Pin-like site-specific DNA recombinase
MRLTKQAIATIRKNAECKRELMYQLKISYTTIYRWLESNNANNDLTKALSLKIISETTGLKQNEILEQ